MTRTSVSADHKKVVEMLSAIQGTDWSAAVDVLATISDLNTNTQFIYQTAITAPTSATINDILAEAALTAISSPAAGSLFAKTNIIVSQVSSLLDYESPPKIQVVPFGDETVELGDEGSFGFEVLDMHGGVLSAGVIDPGNYNLFRTRGLNTVTIVSGTSMVAGRGFAALVSDYYFTSATWAVGDRYFFEFNSAVVSLPGGTVELPTVYMFGRVTRERETLSQTSLTIDYLSSTTYGLSAVLSGISATYGLALDNQGILSYIASYGISANMVSALGLVLPDSMAAWIMSGVAGAGPTYIVSQTVGDSPTTGSVGDMLRDGLMQSGGTILPAGKSLYDILFKDVFSSTSHTFNASAITGGFVTAISWPISTRTKFNNIFIDFQTYQDKNQGTAITVKLQTKIDGTNYRVFDSYVWNISADTGLAIGPFVVESDFKITFTSTTQDTASNSALTYPVKAFYEIMQ